MRRRPGADPRDGHQGADQARGCWAAKRWTRWSRWRWRASPSPWPPAPAAWAG